MQMMTAMLWTLIALLGAVLAMLAVDSRTGWRELRTAIGGLRTEMDTKIGELRTEMDTKIGGLDTKIGTLGTEVHLMAERQAEMNGRLEVVAAMAHTHPPTVAGQ